jgi:pimeloyl-ACP methyl ester carboxylesterase
MKLPHLIPALLLCLTGCISHYLAPSPMSFIRHQKEKSPNTDTLVIFLPGNMMDPEEFEREGFLEILKGLKAPADSWAADARLGYYIRQNLPERLMADVIAPAGKAGYRKIWLVGISMGGSGALWSAKEHPEAVRGVVLLAPFLGDPPVIREIREAGGVRAWQPRMPLEPDDYQRAQWLWLKERPWDKKGAPVMVLGFGDSDRFADAGRLLADILPAGRVFIVPGGHDWDTWRALFVRIVASDMPDW